MDGFDIVSLELLDFRFCIRKRRGYTINQYTKNNMDDSDRVDMFCGN